MKGIYPIYTPEVSTFIFKPNELDFRDDAVRHEIRTVTFADKPNDPWFVAADVCKALGYYVKPDGSVNTSNATRLLAQDEFATAVISGKSKGNGTRQMKVKIISESGLYKLTMRSDKPEAKAFQDWVTRDVLPAIRKDGMYVKGEEKVVTGEMSLDEMTLKVLEGLKVLILHMQRPRRGAVCMAALFVTSSKAGDFTASPEPQKSGRF